MLTELCGFRLTQLTNNRRCPITNNQLTDRVILANYSPIRLGNKRKELVVSARIVNDRLEYSAVIRCIPPNLLRPMIQRLAVVPIQTFTWNLLLGRKFFIEHGAASNILYLDQEGTCIIHKSGREQY